MMVLCMSAKQTSRRDRERERERAAKEQHSASAAAAAAVSNNVDEEVVLLLTDRAHTIL